MVKPHTNGPESPYLLEVQRPVLRVRLQERVAPICQGLDRFRQPAVSPPEPRVGMVLHSALVRPAR